MDTIGHVYGDSVSEQHRSGNREDILTNNGVAVIDCSTRSSNSCASYSEFICYEAPSECDNFTRDNNSLFRSFQIGNMAHEEDKSKLSKIFTPVSKRLSREQFYLLGAASIITAALAIVTVLFAEKIYSAIGGNAGLFLGSIATCCACSYVVISFLRRRHKRHIHSILFNLAFYDLMLAGSFIMEPAWHRLGVGMGVRYRCRPLSIAREYLMMYTTTWSVCMALDLYLLMTDPFTSPRCNRRNYQLISHASGFVCAAILASLKNFDAYMAVGGFCWVGADTRNANYISILSFIAFPILAATSSNIYVACLAYSRFRHGIAASFQNRQELLREGSITTLTLVAYLILTWSLYSASWAVRGVAQKKLLGELFCFMLAYCGCVPCILWELCNQALKANMAERNTNTTSMSHPSVDNQRFASIYNSAASTEAQSPMPNATSLEDEEESDDEDDSERPQMNVALLRDLVFYTTQGIIEASLLTLHRQSENPPNTFRGDAECSARNLRAAIESSTAISNLSYTFFLRPSPTASTSFRCSFTAFFPAEFKKVRELFDIQENRYQASVAKCTRPKVSEGASGSFMFSSADRNFIVKSLTFGESRFLHHILPAYLQYMKSNAGSYLTRFLGSYKIKLYGSRTVYFVVMENIFDVEHGICIHQRYDIKGSWVNRNAQKAKKGSESTCRHCNMTYRCGVGRNVCPHRAGCHEPNVVLKDMDLTAKLRFGKEEGLRIITQLKRDTDFLCEQGIMDYSLLLGVIDVSYQISQQNILTRDGITFSLPTKSSNKEETGLVGHVCRISDRLKQSQRCLHMSETIVGPGFYYIGIIDILQTWTFSKRLERFFKTVVLREDPDGLSAIRPKAYRNRFHRKLDEIIQTGSSMSQNSAANTK